MPEELRCLNHSEDCAGDVEYRMPLSGSGRAFPRCDFHWELRLEVQERINQTYPTLQPADFDPMYAGERWEEEE